MLGYISNTVSISSDVTMNKMPRKLASGENNMNFFYRNRPNIEDHIHGMIDYMIDKHNKVLPVRIDLHFPYNYWQDGSNREIQNFERNVNRYFEYRGIHEVILAVREHRGSHNPHYHVFMCVDGNKLESSYMIFLVCEKIWTKIIKKELLSVGWELSIIEEDCLGGLVHHCDNPPGSELPPMEMIRRKSKFAVGDELAVQREEFGCKTAIDHGLYLPRHSKGNAPKGTREMLGSQIPKKRR